MAKVNQDLSIYRFEQAREALEDSRVALENDRLKNSCNRSYYAVFHAMRAVNALEEFDSKKHSGVRSYFQRSFVKSGKIDKSIAEVGEEK